MKKQILFALCLTACLSLAACSDNAPPKDNEPAPSVGGTVQIPNPITTCDTIEELEKLVGFNFTLPDSMPTGYEQDSVSVIDKHLAEVTFTSGEEKIVVRKAAGSDDISGVYGEYSETDTVKIGDFSVLQKGADGKINLSTWTFGEYTFSVFSSTALEANIVTDIVAGVN